MTEVRLPCSRSTPWVGLSSPGHLLFPTQSVAGNISYPKTYISGHPQGLLCHSGRTGFRSRTVQVLQHHVNLLLPSQAHTDKYLGT